MPPKVALVIIGVLIVLRAVMAGLLPLSGDEAYYLLWSKHLAAGYYDHPPAIAFLIRAGVFWFGENPFGVRAFGILLSVFTSWFIWQTASLILKDERKAALAAVFFNLTLMASVEMLVATPDLPSIATVAAFIWALAKAQATRDGRWWLAAGIAAGLSLLSKYSALFMGLGALAWLLADRNARPWLRTIWPWAGGVIALLLFAPHLVWQSQNDWMTFAFQFGRVGGGNPTIRYVIEFVGAQLGLATPLILALGAIGFWQARKPGQDRFLLFMLVAVALAYFLQHALRDRVQGNWPAFLYPALAILAADAVGKTKAWIGRGAAPLAALILAVVYAHVLFGILPLRNDPAARLLMKNFPAAATSLAETTEVALTTDYETTALLRYYQPKLTVIQLTDPQRYPWAPAASPTLLRRQVVSFYAKRREQTDLVREHVRFLSGPLPHGDGSYEARLIYDPAENFPGKVP
jgi:4-amino-4-deoxy-L-arabinose transferase-like glycosyltransferase